MGKHSKGHTGHAIGGDSTGRKANGDKNMDPVRPADVVPDKAPPVPDHVEGHRLGDR